MTRAYFETSALDAIVKRRIPVSGIRLQLETRGLTASVGTLTLNECAQPILSGEGDVARALFGIIRDLQPRFLADPLDLYAQETRLLRAGTPVNPHPSEAQEDFERDEVNEMADGRINSRLVELVRDRRKAKFECSGDSHVPSRVAEQRQLLGVLDEEVLKFCGRTRDLLPLLA